MEEDPPASRLPPADEEPPSPYLAAELAALASMMKAPAPEDERPPSPDPSPESNE